MTNDQIETVVQSFKFCQAELDTDNLGHNSSCRITDRATGLVYLLSDLNPLLDNLAAAVLIENFLPGTRIYLGLPILIAEQHASFRRYDSLTDLINKRDTFIAGLKQVHQAAAPVGVPIGRHSILDSTYLKLLTAEATVLEASAQARAEYQQLLSAFIQLRRSASLLDSNLVDPVVCFNQLQLSDIYHDGSGTVRFSNWEKLGYNDYAWDYASLLARGDIGASYTAILNNNKLIEELSQRYKDDRVGLRVIICMALVDLADCLAQLSLGNELGQSAIYSNRLTRLTRFVAQSVTTIDYFYYVYKEAK